MYKLAFLALHKINQGIVILDKELKIVFWNAWMERYTDKSREVAIGQELPRLFPALSRKPCYDALQKALTHRQSRFLSGALHRSFVTPAGERKDLRQNLLVEALDYDGEIYVLLQLSDLTGHYSRVRQLKHMIREIDIEFEQAREAERINRYKALHDALTGLPNRYLLYDRLDNAIARAHRNKELLAVVFLDLDGFKYVNDNYGHKAGDLLLQMAADRLKGLLRESDTLARLGGDEFLFVFSQIKNTWDVETIAKRILMALADPFEFGGEGKAYLTASMGISLYPLDAEDGRNLIDRADLAMYQVKNSGKNNYHFYHFDP